MEEPLSGIRTLFIADHFGYSGGVVHGGTTWYLNVLPRLQLAGTSVVACFVAPSHPEAEKLREAGVEVIFLARSRWDPLAFFDILKLIRRHRANVLHVAGMKAILLARLASRFTGIPVISHFHDVNPTAGFIRHLLRMTSSWDFKAIAVSAAVAGYAESTLGTSSQRTQVMRNGIDVCRFVTAGREPTTRAVIRNQFAIPLDAPVVGIVGRFSKEKGHEQFLHSLPHLLTTVPGAHVLLVGDGALRPAFEKLVRQLGGEHVVHFAGSRSDIPEVLQGIDVLAIPSLDEGLSYAALEAMAAGKPVVAFAVGGLPEIVIDRVTGLLAGQRDSNGLISAIAEVLSDGNLHDRVVAGGRQLVERMSLENYIQALLDEYHRASSLRLVEQGQT